MQDAGRIVERAADAGSVPIIRALHELARTEDKVCLFRGVIVIWVTDVRRGKRSPDPDVTATLGPTRANDIGISVIFSKTRPGIGAIACSRTPGQRWLDP